ncbi:MAG: methyltransferase domain-containing protein [Candidatus Marinimicrobia bacterium]|nr:methyltransferase domain-containing protein [Candidatus Neomarinimicrobiota bacterium]
MSINEETLHQLMGQAVVDIGAAMNAPLILLGDRLGLYKKLAAEGPLTSEELATHTSTTERYVREWLGAQAAGGYITYNPDDATYSMSPEQEMIFANENSPAFVVGGFQNAYAASQILDRLEDSFTTGEGIGWNEQNHQLFHGTERFFRPVYLANLVDVWIPALDRVHEKLEKGARVVDIASGHGAPSVILAKAYPNSTFIGFDYHEESVETANQRAKDAGLDDRLQFKTASAKEFGDGPYDLAMAFDCFHDLGDPVGAARNILANLDRDGSFLIVEPQAGDNVQDNLNPVSRAWYAASTAFCTPNALSQDVGFALGGQAGEANLRDAVTQAGFTRFRKATENPFNLILEVKP